MEVTCPGWVGEWVAGWPGSDNKTISVQLNLTGAGTGTELGNNADCWVFYQILCKIVLEIIS